MSDIKYRYDGTENEAILEWLISLYNHSEARWFQFRKVMNLDSVAFEIVLEGQVIAILNGTCHKLLTFERYLPLFEEVKQELIAALEDKKVHAFQQLIEIARDDVILRA